MQIAQLFIEGIPVPKGRPRFFRKGNFSGTYTPGKTKAYENCVRAAGEVYARQNNIRPVDGPVRIDVKFFMPRPKSHTRVQRACPWHFVRPDKDNLEKSIQDGLNGIFFKDDGQVCSGLTEKLYANDMQQAGVSITIIDLDPAGRNGGRTW